MMVLDTPAIIPILIVAAKLMPNMILLLYNLVEVEHLFLPNIYHKTKSTFPV